MSRPRRVTPADMGLRRSNRQRRQVYDTLNQTLLLDGHFNDLLFPDDAAAHRTRSLRSANVREAGTGSLPSTRESKRRPSSEHVASREVVALRNSGGDHGESDTEEILDIYSRVKRRRRCSQRAYVVEPMHHDDSNPSIVTEADSDIVGSGRKQVQQKQHASGVEPESSDSELIEEDTIRQRYFLRPTKPVTKRFEATLPEPRKRRLDFLTKNAENEDDGSDIHASRTSAFHSPAHRRTSRKRFLLSKKPSDSSSESDASDGELKFERKQAKKLQRTRARFLPFNLDEKDAQRSRTKNVGRPRHGASCADVDPMHIDSKIGFDSVGGLTHHIYSLKEMVLFPLMYPDVFAKFKINPPRGVLFYGPPGTGKTLVARALANECSKFDRKVAFFMRKGADCLSKWVGESERQLRLLFDQAYSMRPSIIFFDEIDGLAPVRSSRQDQIHSSIVSTLLALMDGLDDRSDVVVIGATNRLDAIDPALRRPGRFDRELRFSMPDKEARQQILRIHTKDWQPVPCDNLLTQLSARTVGYGGADLKGLCTEAALIALRKAYPQIYVKDQRLALDPNTIKITEEDFTHAMEKQAPCMERSLTAPVRAISNFMEPLMGSTLKSILALLPMEFVRTEGRHDVADVQSVLSTLAKRPPLLGRRILLCGQAADSGQTKYFAPAVLHALDHLPVFSLAIPNLYTSGNRTPEEFISETLTMASRCGPSVLFLPAVDCWDSVVSTTAWATLKTCLDNWTARTSVLIIATAHCPSVELDFEIKTLFANPGIVDVPSTYSDDQRRQFFEPILLVETQRPLVEGKRWVFDELPPAPPPPPRQFTKAELIELLRQEESVLRELRIFLREIALRLFRDRKFAIFAKPVDLEQAPDYYEIVQKPMDLSTIMSKIDQHKYETVEEFLADIDLITQNALEYNPDNDQTDKIIRHRACDLRDVAYALIDSELDWNFEERCKEIQNARRERGESGPVEPPPPYVYTVKTRLMKANEGGASAAPPEEVRVSGHDGVARRSATEEQCYVVLRNKNNNDAASAGAGKAKAAAIVKKYKTNATRRRLFSLKRRNVRKHKKEEEGCKRAVQEVVGPVDPDAAIITENATTSATNAENEVKIANEEEHIDESVELPEPPTVEINVEELKKLLDDVVEMSRHYSLVALERLFVEIEAVVARHANLWDRKGLVAEVRRALNMQ